MAHDSIQALLPAPSRPVQYSTTPTRHLHGQFERFYSVLQLPLGGVVALTIAPRLLYGLNELYKLRRADVRGRVVVVMHPDLLELLEVGLSRVARVVVSSPVGAFRLFRPVSPALCLSPSLSSSLDSPA